MKEDNNNCKFPGLVFLDWCRQNERLITESDAIKLREYLEYAKATETTDTALYADIVRVLNIYERR